jgi:hypothetical protein
MGQERRNEPRKKILDQPFSQDLEVLEHVNEE